MDIDGKLSNLALMKLSAYHKDKGDDVGLNFPFGADLIYASVLQEEHRHRVPPGSSAGGPGWHRPNRLPPEVERCRPDYDLYPKAEYSLGYTYRWCPFSCEWCCVSVMEGWDRSHHSIWEFHDERFDTICLLNNNTFADPQWEATFSEIDDAGLRVVDQNGYDIRLLDAHKAEWLGRLRWRGCVHFAFDQPGLERVWRDKAPLLRSHGFNGNNCLVYVLVGYNTTFEQDMHRVEVVRELGFEPFIMRAHTRSRLLNELSRWCNMKRFRHVPWEVWWKIRTNRVKYRGRRCR